MTELIFLRVFVLCFKGPCAEEENEYVFAIFQAYFEYA